MSLISGSNSREPGVADAFDLKAAIVEKELRLGNLSVFEEFGMLLLRRGSNGFRLRGKTLCSMLRGTVRLINLVGEDIVQHETHCLIRANPRGEKYTPVMHVLAYS